MKVLKAALLAPLLFASFGATQGILPNIFDTIRAILDSLIGCPGANRLSIWGVVAELDEVLGFCSQVVATATATQISTVIVPTLIDGPLSTET